MVERDDEREGQFEDLLLLAVSLVGGLLVGEALGLALKSIQARRARGVRTLPVVAKLEGIVREMVKPPAGETAVVKQLSD